jgi:uncharacterized alkaline shock family protein YloU
MNEQQKPLGNIFVSHRAIATIAYQSAIESYGVVGLAAKNLVEGLAQVLVKDPAKGVAIHYDGDTIGIDLFLIIEYGTRIKSVATSVAESVQYQIERVIGMPVTYVNVHVRGLRISDTD